MSRRYDWSGFGQLNMETSDYGIFSDPYARWQMSRLPVVGDFMRAMDQQKYYNDYLRNTGMSWKDVKYPALLGGQNAVGAGVNSAYTLAGMAVSRNLMRLYR